MTSSLLHLPSRATTPPSRPSSSLSPEAVTPPPSSSLPGIAAGTGPSPRVKQSSLMGFLSPAAAAASPADSKVTRMTSLTGGHSQHFIEDSWQQRLHGRPPKQAPPVQAQPVNSQPQHHAKADKPTGAVTKERGVKRPLDFPQDIHSLLPPEWGGKAGGTADKAKSKGKQKGKTSLTAQYLHPDTIQHSAQGAMQNRPGQLGRVQTTVASSKSDSQQQPHTRPNAAAADATAHKRAEQAQQAEPAQHAQPAQQAQQGSSSSIPWFRSNSNVAAAQQEAAIRNEPLIKTAHSFGSWLKPPWGQHPPQSLSPPVPHPPSPPQGIVRTSDNSALPLPMRNHACNEQRLEQLTAMHHKPALAPQVGKVQTTTNEPSFLSKGASRGAPPSRSPSPVLMEDSEFDAELSSIGRYEPAVHDLDDIYCSFSQTA